MIIDTHTHYDDEAFDEDREELLGRLCNEGIESIINVAANMKGVRNTLELVRSHDFIFGAVGVHPDDVGELDDSAFAELEEAARADKIVAVGEIGLDYYWDKEARELQQEMFVRQIELARRVNLPVIIHSREAAEDTMRIVKEACGNGMRGVMHCYSYSPEQAKEYLDMGLYLGIGGVLTFKNAKKLKEAVALAPLERLVLETDCPYLAPEPNRGKRNSSLNLSYVAEAIAAIKGVRSEEIIEATNVNARRLFGLKPGK